MGREPKIRGTKMTRQARYEARRREAGNTTTSARLTEQQAAIIKTAGGPTTVLRCIADALLAGGEIRIISGEGEQGTVETFGGERTLPAIRQRLGRERQQGDRWARAEIVVGENAYGEIKIDAETGVTR